MDMFGDFLWQFKPVFSGIYWLVAGQFIPSSCQWCRPLFWLSEAALVGFIVIYLSPQGPRTG